MISRVGKLVATAVLAGAASALIASGAGAGDYYVKERSKLTIGYAYNDGVEIIGLKGAVVPRSAHICKAHRPVKLIFQPPTGIQQYSWLTTSEGGNWGVLGALDSGTYHTHIAAEVRFQRFGGERRKMLCRGGRSPDFVVP